MCRDITPPASSPRQEKPSPALITPPALIDCMHASFKDQFLQVSVQGHCLHFSMEQTPAKQRILPTGVVFVCKGPWIPRATTLPFQNSMAAPHLGLLLAVRVPARGARTRVGKLVAEWLKLSLCAAWSSFDQTAQQPNFEKCPPPLLLVPPVLDLVTSCRSQFSAQPGPCCRENIFAIIM